MKVRIAGITSESVVDGPGIRATVFFQGCTHACRDCQNPQTWDLNGGREITTEEVITQLKLTPLVTGITFSGGEPFLQAEAAAELGRCLKARGLGLWIYTGFLWEELLMNRDRPGFDALIAVADVIMDGPFLPEQRSLNAVFRGSANQRAILAKESLELGKIVEWSPERMAI